MPSPIEPISEAQSSSPVERPITEQNTMATVSTTLTSMPLSAITITSRYGMIFRKEMSDTGASNSILSPL